jgi:hypothetical protein
MSLTITYFERKIKINTTPMMTLKEILNKACEHFNITIPTSYTLFYKSKPVNLSLPLRMSGISSQFSLELKPHKSIVFAVDGNCQVALQYGEKRYIFLNLYDIKFIQF